MSTSGWSSLICAMPFRSRSAVTRMSAMPWASITLRTPSLRTVLREAHRDGAEVGELRAEDVAGLDRRHLVHGAGQDDVPRLEPGPEGPELVCQAGHAARRVAQRRGPAAGVQELAVPGHHDTEQPQVEIGH